MSLQKYKKIEDNRGFFIEDRDSSIFETTNSRSLYGSGENDVIKFALYDANENILPQEGYGNERFIHSKDFQKYFRITNNEGSNQPEQYEIDVDTLIEEAGYNTGIFNVEILLVNDRVGSNYETDRLWIHEISPSRTEIRVVPLQNRNEDLQSRLEERYQAFIENEIFLDDVREVLDELIGLIDVTNIEEKLLQLFGTKFVRQLKLQFFPEGGFNITMIRIAEDFKDAVRYVVENKNSSIGDPQFGTDLQTDPPVSIDINRVVSLKLRESISFHLPMLADRTQRNSVYNRRERDEETQVLIDKVISDSSNEGSSIKVPTEVSFVNDTYILEDQEGRTVITLPSNITEQVVPESFSAPPRTPAQPPVGKVDMQRIKKILNAD